MSATAVETRVVVIERCPPRRLLDPLRYRSFKLGPDYQVWDQVMGPVRELVADGWRMTHVLVDWGPSEPLTPGRRDEATRQVTECWGSCELQMTAGSPGRGRTTFTLEQRERTEQAQGVET